MHLTAAKGKGNVMVVEILLHNGANINEKDVRNHRIEKWWRRWKDCRWLVRVRKEEKEERILEN